MQKLYETHSAGNIFLGLADAAGKPMNRNSIEADDFFHWLQLRWKDIHSSSGSTKSFNDFWNESL